MLQSRERHYSILNENFKGVVRVFACTKPLFGDWEPANGHLLACLRTTTTPCKVTVNPEIKLLDAGPIIASNGQNEPLSYSPRVYACLVRTLGHTAVPLATNGASNVYKQATTMLLQAYINRSSPLAQILLHHNSLTASAEAGMSLNRLEIPLLQVIPSWPLPKQSVHALQSPEPHITSS